MMKKHNEGYTLVLVLVVMVVLCLVSVSVMTFSLRNLQNQQASVERMQAKYAAEGEIEQDLGKIIQDITFEYADGNATTELDDAAKCDLIRSKIEEMHQITLENIQVQSSQNTFSYDAVLSKEKDTYKVITTVTISGKMEFTTENNKKVCKLTEKEVTYKSYEISTVTPTEGGTNE